MDEQRAEFEAWAKSKGAPKDGWWIRQIDDGGYSCHAVDMAWDAWQAATQRQQERIAELERDLKFVERWANHHGAKPHTTAESALSVIQHYPPITAITRGYADGVVPDTFDPYARIAELEAQVQALSMDAFAKDASIGHLSRLVDAERTDAARYQWLRGRDLETISHGGVFAGKTPDNVILNGEDLDSAIDAAIARATHKEQT